MHMVAERKESDLPIEQSQEPHKIKRNAGMRTDEERGFVADPPEIRPVRVAPVDRERYFRDQYGRGLRHVDLSHNADSKKSRTSRSR